FPAWLSDVLPRRTGRSAVLFSAFGQLLGTPGRAVAIAIIGVGLVLASRFEPGSDPWLALWLALSSAGAIYSWSYDQVLLFVPIVIASGVLVRAGREVAARRLAIGAALTFLLVSPVFYAVGVVRHDETFSIAVPVALFVAIAWSLWPYRRTASVRERSAQQVQPASERPPASVSGGAKPDLQAASLPACDRTELARVVAVRRHEEDVGTKSATLCLERLRIRGRTDDRAGEPARGIGRIGERSRDVPGRQRLGHREPPPPGLESTADHAREGLVVRAPDVVAESRADCSLHFHDL